MHIDQIGRFLHYLRILILEILRVFDIFMAFGQWFHNLAASMLKLLSAFFVWTNLVSHSSLAKISYLMKSVVQEKEQFLWNIKVY